MRGRVSRRDLLGGAMGAVVGLGIQWGRSAESPQPGSLENQTLDFILRCARDDGGFAPSPDPKYEGNSDTAMSDLAAVTYASTLAKTMGWKLPAPAKSIEFIQRHQRPDGAFANQAGRLNPDDPLAILYNTVQGAVSLRALGARPRIDPAPVMDRFFVNDAYKKLPWYTTSFFPLFFAALDKPFPRAQDQALRNWQTVSQAEDGYLGDHVAATFHLAHYFRLIGEPTPRAEPMVQRVLKAQKADGGFDIKEPDWDVHACFDAVFILRQLGNDTGPVKAAIDKAADWAMRCRNADGGFGHFPRRHSDMDAVYFQFGTLIQAGRVKGAKLDLPDGQTLSWGHAMRPGKRY